VMPQTRKIATSCVLCSCAPNVRAKPEMLPRLAAQPTGPSRRPAGGASEQGRESQLAWLRRGSVRILGGNAVHRNPDCPILFSASTLMNQGLHSHTAIRIADWGEAVAVSTRCHVQHARAGDLRSRGRQCRRQQVVLRSLGRPCASRRNCLPSRSRMPLLIYRCGAVEGVSWVIGAGSCV